MVMTKGWKLLVMNAILNGVYFSLLFIFVVLDALELPKINVIDVLNPDN